MKNKTIRVKFIGRKRENNNQDFNYYIEQTVQAQDLGDALTALEEKYIVKQTVENYSECKRIKMENIL